MLYKPNAVEKKQERLRIIIALAISAALHIILILAFLLVSNIQPKDEEIVIVKVQLRDKVIEEFKAKPPKEKEKILKKIQKEKEKEKKKIIKEKKKIEKKIEKTKKEIENKVEKPVDNKPVEEKKVEKIEKPEDKKIEESKITEEKPVENIPEKVDKKEIEEEKQFTEDKKEEVVDKEGKIEDVKQQPEDKDIFEEYEKELTDKDTSVEDEFFSDEPDRKDEDEDTLASLDEELDQVDEDLEFLNSLVDDTPENESTKEDGGGTDITWQGSRERKLIESTKLDIPEKFKKEGIKTSIKLKFTVTPEGLISKVDVLISTGYTELDQAIVNQFKRWRFEGSSDAGESIGTLPIEIRY